MSPIPLSGRTRRLAGVVVAACALALPAGAEAATNNAYINVSVYPAGTFDTPGTPATGRTGDYYGYYSSGTGSVRSRTQQVRGGAVISTESGGPTGAPVTILPGDTFQLVDVRSGQVLASTTYDGTPSLDPTTCIGNGGFAGTRAAGADVSVRTYGPLTLRPGRYGGYTSPLRQVGRLTSIGETTFAGAFPGPVSADEQLSVTQTVETVANDTEYSFTTSVRRAPGACPPPAPDITPAGVTAFQFGSAKTLLRAFRKFGLTTFLTLDSPGKVVQKLYLNNGAKVPATVAAKPKKPKKPRKKLILLGQGSATAAAPGVVRVTVKPTKKGKAALKGKKSAKVILVTTVRDTAGNVTKVAPRKFTLVSG